MIILSDPVYMPLHIIYPILGALTLSPILVILLIRFIRRKRK